MSVACLFQVTLQRYEDNVEQPNDWQDYFVFFPDFVLLYFIVYPHTSLLREKGYLFRQGGTGP